MHVYIDRGVHYNQGCAVSQNQYRISFHQYVSTYYIRYLFQVRIGPNFSHCNIKFISHQRKKNVACFENSPCLAGGTKGLTYTCSEENWCLTLFLHRLYIIIRGQKSECNATIKQRKNQETSAIENPLYAETSCKSKYSIVSIFARHIKEISSKPRLPLTLYSNSRQHNWTLCNWLPNSNSKSNAWNNNPRRNLKQ